jgi:hypothetical protein
MTSRTDVICFCVQNRLNFRMFTIALTLLGISLPDTDLKRTYVQAVSKGPIIMITGADVAALKAYVQGPDGGMQNRNSSTVLLQVSHSNLSARFMEIRLDQHVSRLFTPVNNSFKLRALLLCLKEHDISAADVHRECESEARHTLWHFSKKYGAAAERPSRGSHGEHAGRPHAWLLFTLRWVRSGLALCRNT